MDKINAPRTILMLAGHEPTLDPRIDWEAASLAKTHRVTVAGILQPELGARPFDKKPSDYEIVRLQRIPSTLRTLFNYFYMLLPNKYAKTLLLIFSPLIILVSFVSEIIAKILFALYLIITLRLHFFIQDILLPPLNGIATVTTQIIKSYLSISTNIAFKQNPLSSPATTHNEAPTKKNITFFSKSCNYIRRLISKFLQYQKREIFLLPTYLSLYFIPNTVTFVNYVDAMPIKPQVLHCNDLDTLLAGVLIKNKYHCKLIYDAHEFFTHADPRFDRFTRFFFHHFERLLLKHVDHAITVNHYLAHCFRNSYKKSFISIPNAAPYQALSENQRRSEMTTIANQRIKFLYQGNFAAQRGLEEIIKAWVHIDPNKAVLFMRGPDSPHKITLIYLAEQLDLLNKRVFFITPVAEDDLINAASEADVGIIPYNFPGKSFYRYACPNKLSQYLQAGTPILCNHLPYIRRIVNKANAGLIYNANDINSIVTAVNKFIDTPALREKCRNNALAFAKNTFNWDSIFNKHAYIYA